ncbi:MAG: hypothetical protein NZ571_12330, partial [Anaerolineae bacterium]|nr:hypothetical protein [Anaerolineae bacterium]
MSLNKEQFSNLVGLLTPIFQEVARRRSLLTLAFFGAENKYSTVPIEGAAVDFTTALIHHLSHAPADLLALLEAVQGQYEGNLAQDIEPFVKQLRQQLSSQLVTNIEEQRYKLFITYRRVDWAFAHR